MTPEESLSRLKGISLLAKQKGVNVNVTMATSFGCPFTGEVPAERVMEMANAVLLNGASSLTFADTTGMANPAQVYHLMNDFRRCHPDTAVTLHFHNTRGMGMANILAGLMAGIIHFDASLGGLGGCPFAPGATGNVASEDVVHMLEEMGVKTGINLDGLINASRELEMIIGRKLPGQVIKAGKTRDLHPLPCNLQ